MNRDMDLIRKLAIHIESANGPLDSEQIAIEGHSQEQIGYHCELMEEAGLISVDVLGRQDPRFRVLLILRLTWAGHEFLDAAKDEKLWNKVTKQVKDKVTSMAFDGLLGMLKAAGRQAVQQGWELVAQ